jgi:plasmid maintenance system killer protein
LINTVVDKNKLRKKLAGLKKHYSIKVSTNYRVLWSDSGDFFVGKHNHYDRKIKNIKRMGA